MFSKITMAATVFLPPARPNKPLANPGAFHHGQALMFRRLLIALLLLSPLSRADDTALRAELERVYSDWRAALLAKSVEAWKRSTSAYRQVYTRNMIVSQGRTYPDALFDLPLRPPSVMDLKLVEVEAVGDTAHLLYFGRIDLGIDAKEIPENLMMLKFYKEQGTWKFDTTKYINLMNNPEMRDALRSGKPDFVKQPPFNPPGNAPEIPKLCGKPEYIGALRIHAVGYEVAANLNGFDYTPVADDAEQQLAIGGYNRGANKLVLQVRQLPIPDDPEASRHLEIQAVIAIDNPEQPTKRVFRWEPQQHPVPAQVELNIVLDNATLKGL